MRNKNSISCQIMIRQKCDEDGVQTIISPSFQHTTEVAMKKIHYSELKQTCDISK